jgi:RNA polymerase sigma-70 factor (ECF subfamily)
MQLYGQGDIAAFELLYTKHKGGLYRYFLRHTADQGVAEDLYQEVWGRVINSAASYQPKAKFNTWLYTLAHNKLIDHVRRLKVVNTVFDVNSELDDDIDTESVLVNDIVERELAGISLKQCLSKLPQMQLDCFLLKEEAGMTLYDISQIVGASLEATKSRMRYAYKSLRTCIANKISKVAI